MKMTARYWLAVAVGLGLAGTASAGLIQDTFESYADLTPLLGGTNRQWYGSDASVQVQTAKFNTGSKAAVVTEYQTLTNLVGSPSDTKLWSDFYTLPRRYSADTTTGPAADPTATAQIYLTSNGEWAVIYRTGLAGTITTNVIPTVPAVPDDTNTWQHVSVLHNYSAKTWALFVDGVPLVTNLTFIDTGATAYNWFNMQNRGGGSAYLDDVTITNRVPLTLTNDVDGDAMIDAWEIMYYGSTNATDDLFADDDGDGLLNGNEARQLFDPTSASDPRDIIAVYAANIPFYDDFENEASGGLYGKRGWNAALTSRVNLVSSPVFMGTQAVQIVAATASHTFDYPTTSATSVWTHLVMKPVPMSEEQSRLARTDTVAFYVDTNYVVNAYNSNTWVKLTNIMSTVGVTSSVPFLVDPTKWVRFVTKSDYNSRKWSLYAENVTTGTSNVYARLLASDLNFSTSGAAYTSYHSLIIENMLDPNTTSYLDNVEITLNTSPWVDTDGDMVPDAYEEVNDLESTNFNGDANGNQLTDSEEYAWGGTNEGRIVGVNLTNNTSPAVQMLAEVYPGRTYQVVGTSDPDAPFTPVGSFYTGPGGETNSFIDVDGLTRGGRYFYRLLSSSPDGFVVVTNDETYAWYKQQRYVQNNDYVVGVPVSYGTNNTLDGRLGADLARSLAGGAGESDSDTLHVMLADGVTFKNFYLASGNPPTWCDFGGSTPATQAVPVGAAVQIKRKALPAATTNAILAGLQQTNNITLPINVGWNLVGWPYDSTNTWAWGLPNANVSGIASNRDEVYLVRNGLYINLRPETPTVWKIYGRPGAPTLLTDERPYLQPGEAFYYRRVGSGDTWAPVNP